jgi:hypothetical protein
MHFIGWLYGDEEAQIIPASSRRNCSNKQHLLRRFILCERIHRFLLIIQQNKYLKNRSTGIGIAQNDCGKWRRISSLLDAKGNKIHGRNPIGLYKMEKFGQKCAEYCHHTKMDFGMVKISKISTEHFSFLVFGLKNVYRSPLFCSFIRYWIYSLFHTAHSNIHFSLAQNGMG